MINKKLARILAIAIGTTSPMAQGQSKPVPPNVQSVPPNVGGAYGSFGRLGLACGGGATYSASATAPAGLRGLVLGAAFFDLEVGIQGAQAAPSSGSGYLSANAWFPLRSPQAKYGFPLLQGGYTRIFKSGSGVDYGLAYAFPLDYSHSHSIQLEARDYWVFANPQQHDVVLGIAWLVGLPD